MASLWLHSSSVFLWAVLLSTDHIFHTVGCIPWFQHSCWARRDIHTPFFNIHWLQYENSVPSCFDMVLLLGWQGVLLWRSIQHTWASHHSTFSRDLTQQEGFSCLLANQLELLPQVIIGLLWFVSEFHRCSPQKLVKLKAFTVWRSPWVFLLETKYTRFSVGWGTCEIFNCKQCWCQTLGCWETFLGVSWVHVLASSLQWLALSMYQILQQETSSQCAVSAV